MNIIFLGTPEFAVPSLDILFRSGYPVKAVITAPDKPSGRGLILNQSPVKKYATEKGVLLFQPARLTDREFLSSINQLHPDLN